MTWCHYGKRPGQTRNRQFQDNKYRVRSLRGTQGKLSASPGRVSTDLQCVRILGSAGCASHDDQSALEDLRLHHPCHDLPVWCHNIPPSLVVDSAAVIAALQVFLRKSSPGGSKLRSQHLLNAIVGTSSPFATCCRDQLTYFMNKLVSGKLDRRIAPWLSGAPLTALRKKPSGFRPIAVGEVLHRLASRLCCSAVLWQTLSFHMVR